MSTFLWGGGFDLMFSIVFVLVVGMFAVTLIKGIGEWHQNNQSPRLTVDAVLLGKRQKITHHSHPTAGDATGAHGFHTSVSTSYYVTFQVESGDRMEFLIGSRDYGLLAEGDRGRLSFQGTRYLGFERF